MTTRTQIAIEYLPASALRPDAFNPRRISDEQLEALTRSIQEFGLVDPIIVRRGDRQVIGGHQRLIAARRLGIERVPVVLLDVSLEQARLLNLGLNRIGGEWDRELHPTMKPLELVERSIENSSRPGDEVLDLFLGSGTTLIAAERTGRSCFAMEIDPRYCRVAIARWEAFASLRARKLLDG